MWTSLEILVPRIEAEANPDFSDLRIKVVKSSPPKSHRRSSSLWQKDFDRVGGTLFHLGDPNEIKKRADRYYLYD
jgi:hypothetical protein